MKENRYPAVFIDRDGTLNEDRGYINSKENFEIYPFVFQALRLLAQFNILRIIITNQAGIAKGYFTEKTLLEIHTKLEQKATSAGASIDGIYYCPHHTDGKVADYALDCSCRKPKTGLIDKALTDFPIDKKKMYMVGDKYTDMLAGINAGCKKNILVKTGYGKGEIELNYSRWNRKPDMVVETLLDAVLFIIKDLRGK